MADLDRSGKLGFEEFQTLWADINLWKVKYLIQELEFSLKVKNLFKYMYFISDCV